MKVNKELEEKLKKEHADMLKKRNKLDKYLNQLTSGEIDYRNCYNSISLLIAQLYAMDTYIQILRLRCNELLIRTEDLIHES